MRSIGSAVRALRRTPGFTLASLLALSLGIGAATTVFSVADRTLFKPLPYSQIDRLITVGANISARGLTGWGISTDELIAWRKASRTLSTLEGWHTFGSYTVSLPDGPFEIKVNRVTIGFLPMLGIGAAIGRPFTQADFEQGGPLAVLLTDRTWRREFGADKSVAGRFVTINGAPAEIAGVLPASFVFPIAYERDAPDALIPLVAGSSQSRVSMIGRLSAGTTVEAARTELDGIAASRKPDVGLRTSPADGASVEPLADALGFGRHRVLTLLLWAVGALLFIGCVNVANLLLARGADRRGELAIRSALGASRAALVRLLLTESAVLATFGAAIGAVLAYLAVGVVGPLIPSELQRFGEVTLDVRALGFAAVTAVAATLIAGAGPAMAAGNVSVSSALAASASRATGARWRMRQVLISFEVALAVVLLVAGGLMIHTMWRLLHIDAGYSADSVLTMSVKLPRGKDYPERSKAFVQQVIDAADAVPGVAHAGATAFPPVTRTLYGGHYRVEGFSQEWLRRNAAEGGVCCTQTQYVSTSFFEASGISVVGGRGFVPADASAAMPVAVISERLARKFPADRNPVGSYLTSAEEGSTDMSDRRLIVGVVRDVRDMNLERAGLQAIYLPLEERGAAELTLIARTHVPPMAIASTVRDAVRRAAGPVITGEAVTLRELVLRSVGPRRLNAWLFGAFAVLGLLLAATGLGSVVSYSVARRTREMGVRLALGAAPSSVKWLVIRESMTAVLAGLVAGVGAALMLGRYVETLLYGVRPRDPWTFVIVCVLLIGSALVAAWLPARRAARTDPLVALRAE